MDRRVSRKFFVLTTEKQQILTAKTKMCANSAEFGSALPDGACFVVGEDLSQVCLPPGNHRICPPSINLPSAGGIQNEL